MRRTACRLVPVVLLLTACTDPPPRRQPRPRPSDKAALFGDAALIPTRAGERARAEVALAEELRVALETLHPVAAARVTVTTQPDGTPRSAALVLRTRTDAPTEPLRSSAERLAFAALGSGEVELAIEISGPQADVPSEDTPPHRRPLVLFAVLGLGISIGLTFDRARRAFRGRA